MRLDLPMIIQRILLDPSGAVWTDQIDAEHPALTTECHRTGPSWASTCGAVAVW
jgi:hypothetical protein